MPFAPVEAIPLKTPLLLALLVLAPLAAAASTTTVHLVVDTTLDAAPALATCEVTVPTGSTLAAALDQAVADLCIVEWSCTEFPWDCRIDSIDGLRAASDTPFLTFWAIFENGDWAMSGVRGTTVSPGTTYTFTYEQGVVFPSPI